MFLKVFFLSFLFNYSHTFIVPQELPSILSLIYSSIPPIRKGSDSRYGIGFRLGEHADFQVLLELGPQKNTRPIGANAEIIPNNKRDAELEDDPIKPSQTKANSWLTSWSENTKLPAPDDQSIKTNVKPFIANDALHQLQKLYGKTSTSNDDGTGIHNESLGTLPASVLENNDTPTKFKIALPDFDKPSKTKFTPKNSSNKSKSKVTADLMDVALD